MKIFITLLFFFSNTLFAGDIAIEAVKKHPKIIEFLSTKPISKYWVDFHKMQLGGQCGFTGCQWRKLVSLIVTSKASNASSMTIIALVSGNNANVSNEVAIEFVELNRITAQELSIN